VVSAGKLAPSVSRVLGWSILALVFLRWGEVLIYGNIGAWTGTHLLTQNTYGFLFSTFSPFLMVMYFSERKWESRFAVFGNVLLWGAVAINGSRGSWIAILAGVIIFLALLGWSQPRKAVGGVFFFLFMIGFAFLAFSASTQISYAVESRLNTFQNLNEEKSYVIRQLMDQKALRLFEQSPWFGVGAGRFLVSSVPLDIPQVLRYADQAHFDEKSPHNSYLGFLAENGLFGAVPFGILLLLFATLGFKSAISLSRQKQYWGMAVYVSFIGMSIHMWSISSLTNTANWFVYGLVAAMIILAQTEFKEKSETRLSLSRSRHL
jgi:O-antigen ligase